MSLSLFVLELIGTVAFALSGGLKGIKHGMDIFGVVVLGLVTGVGGGVIRDAIIGNTPAAVFRDPLLAWVALGVSLLLFLVACLFRHIQKKARVWDIFFFLADTVGLAVFTITGISTAQEAGITDFTGLVCVGVITATGGGVLRDLFSDEVPHLFRKHIYALASVSGAIVDLMLLRIVPQYTAAAVGMLVILLFRCPAALFRWNLPRAPLPEHRPES